jgi:hypothetical protein
MHGSRPRSFRFTLAAWLAMGSVALSGWGIYDPVTNQHFSKSAGSKTCSGIADVAGTVTVKLYDKDTSTTPTTYTLEDSASGTADNSMYHFWSATLTASGAWSTGVHELRLLDSSSVVQATTDPIVDP